MKLTEINCSLLSEPSLGSSKPLIDPRVPKQLHQTDSASAIIVQVGRYLPIVSYSVVFLESYQQDYILIIST